MGVQDEADQFGMRLGQGHAMQVDPRLGLEFAAPHAGMRLGIHQDRRVIKAFGQAGGEVVDHGFAGLFAQGETGQARRRGVMDSDGPGRQVKFEAGRRGMHRLGGTGHGLPQLLLLGP